MIEVLKYEGKTEEELLSKIEINDYHYKIEEIPGKLFKGKKFILSAISKNQVKEFIKEYINNITKAMQISTNMEIRYKDDCYNIMLITESNAILIGKDGKTLNSIQLLTHQAINIATGLNIKISIDAAGYKANKEKRLEREIKNIAKEVIQSKIEVKLDPMNSYERRLVHNIIGTYKELKSESFGEDPARYIVITYKED